LKPIVPETTVVPTNKHTYLSIETRDLVVHAFLRKIVPTSQKAVKSIKELLSTGYIGYPHNFYISRSERELLTLSWKHSQIRASDEENKGYQDETFYCRRRLVQDVPFGH
jgi:hypothetical protein